jgi:hypothetical protein
MVRTRISLYDREVTQFDWNEWELLPEMEKWCFDNRIVYNIDSCPIYSRVGYITDWVHDMFIDTEEEAALFKLKWR